MVREFDALGAFGVATRRRTRATWSRWPSPACGLTGADRSPLCEPARSASPWPNSRRHGSSYADGDRRSTAERFGRRPAGCRVDGAGSQSIARRTTPPDVLALRRNVGPSLSTRPSADRSGDRAAAGVGSSSARSRWWYRAGSCCSPRCGWRSGRPRRNAVRRMPRHLPRGGRRLPLGVRSVRRALLDDAGRAINLRRHQCPCRHRDSGELAGARRGGGTGDAWGHLLLEAWLPRGGRGPRAGRRGLRGCWRLPAVAADSAPRLQPVEGGHHAVDHRRELGLRVLAARPRARHPATDGTPNRPGLDDRRTGRHFLLAWTDDHSGAGWSAGRSPGSAWASVRRACPYSPSISPTTTTPAATAAPARWPAR